MTALLAVTASSLLAAAVYFTVQAVDKAARRYVGARRLGHRLKRELSVPSPTAAVLARLTDAWLATRAGRRFDSAAANARVSGGRATAQSMAAMIVAALAMGLLTGSPLSSLAAVLAVGAGIHVWLNNRARRIEERFRQQVPEALDLIGQALVAGGSLHQAIGHAASQVGSPLGEELARVVEEVSVGMGLDAALGELVDRVPVTELRVVIAAIAIQHRAGGNLAALLAQTADLVRERMAMRQDLMVETAQARFSAKVIGLMPVAVMVLVSLIDPEFMTPLYTTTLGLVLLSAAVLAEVAGFILMRRVLRVGL